jgi:hypothetical protein
VFFTKDKNLSGFLGNLISNIFVDLKSHGLIEALRSAVIAAAEGALEPALLDDVLIIIFYHILLYAVLTCRGAAAVQDYGLSSSQVEALFAEITSKLRFHVRM